MCGLTVLINALLAMHERFGCMTLTGDYGVDFPYRLLKTKASAVRCTSTSPYEPVLGVGPKA